MPDYTTPRGIPYPKKSDKIAATEENLRLLLKASAEKIDQQIGIEGTNAAQAAFDVLDPRLTEAEDVTKANPIRVRGTLDPLQDVFGMTSPSWNGLWTIGSANTNPSLPAQPGVAAKLLVENSANDKYMRIDYRDSAGTYEVRGQQTTWWSWSRVDNPISYKGVVPADTALSTYTARSKSGIFRILENRNNPDLPDVPSGWNAAGFCNLTDGQSTALHIVWYNNQATSGKNAFFRVQTGTSGLFTAWFQMGGSGEGGDIVALEQRISLLEEMYRYPETPFENTSIFSSYAAGEAYMDWIARTYPDKIKLLDLGSSTRGLPIRAFQLGNPNKPTLYVMAAQHGDEPMGRETAYLWVRELCQDTSIDLVTFLSNACIVVAPVINADRINVSRLSSTGTDLNGNWPTESTAEVKAAAKVFSTHNVVLTVDAHEGGGVTQMKTALPNAPEVASSLKNMATELNGFVGSAFTNAGEPFGEFPGASTLTQARNVIAQRYKSTTILFECPSLLEANMYFPDVSWRKELLMLAYGSVFTHFSNNLSSYTSAKALAG